MYVPRGHTGCVTVSHADKCKSISRMLPSIRLSARLDFLDVPTAYRQQKDLQSRSVKTATKPATARRRRKEKGKNQYQASHDCNQADALRTPPEQSWRKPRVCDILVPDHGTSGRLSCMVLWQTWPGLVRKGAGRISCIAARRAMFWICTCTLGDWCLGFAVEVVEKGWDGMIGCWRLADGRTLSMQPYMLS